MSVLRWSTPSKEITERVSVRLREGSSGNNRVVLWEQKGQQLLLHLTTLRMVIKSGWILANLTVETESTGRRVLQFVFFVGVDGEEDGPHAGGTVHTDSREGAQLAEIWGDDLQRVVWDGVLDVIEGCLELSARRSPGDEQSILGFSCHEGQLHVDVLAGDA